MRNGTGVTAPVLSGGAANYTPGISERRSGTTKYRSSDIKNATQQLNTSQTITASKQYDAFGNVTSSSGTWNGPSSYGGTYGYQSEPESGLMLLGHRYDDSSSGRFLSREPVSAGTNWYAYCQNYPQSNADPSGLMMLGVLPILLNPPARRLAPIAWVHIEGDFNWFGDLNAARTIARPMLIRFEATFGEPFGLVDPTQNFEAVKDALANAQGAVLIGHRHGGSMELGSGMEANGLIIPDLKEIEDMRRSKGYRKMNRVYLQYCESCTPAAVAAWKRISENVVGWDHEFSYFSFWYQCDVAQLW
jgi:RHS repeat-associated protein